MGRTVPTFREILNREKEKWLEFKNSLKENERKTFEKLLEDCELHVSASSQVKSPNPFREMTMSILLEQQKEIDSLRKELDRLKKLVGG
ncbi:hypothetical protein AKJ36_03340 [candidate division MSBL1 archaeon SCGC-AAA259I07]|uniref:DUF8156 domain-containing protein n=1 Tax=candidate division MSBL1 archaeon SCGC-AAA259I07 TaxID=1698266 RepID=A0A133UIZ7_9EURY|nr:hypothetical protein AKJ36_03340 [candidate division MSBL1 archaeon SCGC-AAA259I07]